MVKVYESKESLFACMCELSNAGIFDDWGHIEEHMAQAIHDL